MQAPLGDAIRSGDAPSEFVLIFKTGLFDASKTFLVTDCIYRPLVFAFYADFNNQG